MYNSSTQFQWLVAVPLNPSQEINPLLSNLINIFSWNSPYIEYIMFIHYLLYKYLGHIKKCRCSSLIHVKKIYRYITKILFLLMFDSSSPSNPNPIHMQHHPETMVLVRILHI